MYVRLLIGAAGVAALALLAGTASIATAHPHDDLAALRASTDQFHSIAVAEQHEYALLTDAQGVPCIDEPGMGGMDVHWANSSLVGDPAIVSTTPEALVYAQRRDGTLQLAAVEYVVLKQAWDDTHSYPPTLLGESFNFTDAPNRFGLSPYYSLHVWAWKHNPAGRFEMWNPRVTCPAG
jgi:hypothetical protein